MSNKNESKWTLKMLTTCAIFIDLSVLSYFIIMPLFKFIQEIFKLIYFTIVSYLNISSYRKKNKPKSNNKTTKFLFFSRKNLCSIVFYVYMNTNRSINMGHVFKHYFIRDAKLSFEPHLYLLERECTEVD
jgi:hypothetical protein